VLYLSTECQNQGHPAAFPLELPSWFIKLFTQPGDVVLDPFTDSGTTLVAARQLGRHYVGIELVEVYYQGALERLRQTIVPSAATATNDNITTSDQAGLGQAAVAIPPTPTGQAKAQVA
jgi:DNA modification methylase